MIYINFIEYNKDKFINYGFSCLDKNIDINSLEILTKHIHNSILKNDIFKNNNICIFNQNNNKLIITSCFDDNIEIPVKNLKYKYYYF